MGQFSTEIYIPPGSTLSGNQHHRVLCLRQGQHFKRQGLTQIVQPEKRTRHVG